jgi:DNA-binding transcriptional ArsR family regulator
MDVFAAIADPTRRSILEDLASGERDAGTIASGFPISQPAVSQHLAVLRDAGLVAVRREGTRRVYRLDDGGLEPLGEWVDRYRTMWAGRLDRLQAEAEEGSDG